MSKSMKSKKNKVPKINEEEYAAYISLLKEEEKTPKELGKIRRTAGFSDGEDKTG